MTNYIQSIQVNKCDTILTDSFLDSDWQHESLVAGVDRDDHVHDLDKVLAGEVGTKSLKTFLSAQVSI